MKNKAVCLGLLFLCSSFFAFGMESEKKEKKSAAKSPAPASRNEGALGVKVKVSGRVRLVGNNPFPDLVITGENREWFISKEDESKLLDFQQQFVTVEGVETYADLSFANGLSAGRRYTLKNIKLIE
ncbi:MAG: hypothetical protein LBC53_07330 [Spirochaetaceae bacterium]|jgi:hypothetical protein|nr:hypothetical protein [Spirochaetaceae bacterium]